MKKIISILLASAMVLVASAQIRDAKDINKMIKKGVINEKAVLIEYRGAVWNKHLVTKEISLRNPIKGYELNSIEKALLENYDDVLISGYFPNAYFVILDNLIGIYSLKGDCVIPPIPGYPRHLSGTKRIFFGDTMPIDRYDTYISGARGKARRAYAGDFAAVLDFETLEQVIPFGKYDEIHWTMKGLSSYYYVNKYDGVEMKWGVCDKHGKEIVPCEYSYVGLKSGEFVGDNSKKMEDEMAALNVILKRREYNNKHEWQRIGNAVAKVATSIGKAVVTLDENLRESGGYDAINSLASYYGQSNTNNTSNGYNTYGNNSISSANNANKVDASSSGMTLSDQTNYNSMRNTYMKWADDLQQMKYANGKYQNGFTQSQKSHAQSEMKRIRKTIKQKWGKDVYNSIEDW